MVKPEMIAVHEYFKEGSRSVSPFLVQSGGLSSYEVYRVITDTRPTSFRRTMRSVCELYRSR